MPAWVESVSEGAIRRYRCLQERGYEVTVAWYRLPPLLLVSRETFGVGVAPHSGALVEFLRDRRRRGYFQGLGET
jgi:hypothetical protein